jgi:hypothetical protein
MIKDYFTSLIKDSFPVSYDTNNYCNLVLLDISSNKYGGLENLVSRGSVGIGFSSNFKFGNLVFPNSGKSLKVSKNLVSQPYVGNNRPLNLHEVK